MATDNINIKKLNQTKYDTGSKQDTSVNSISDEDLLIFAGDSQNVKLSDNSTSIFGANKTKSVNNALNLKNSSIKSLNGGKSITAKDLQSNPELKKAVIAKLREQFNNVKRSYEITKSEQGFFGKLWDGVKGTLGTSPEGKAWYNPAKWWGTVCNKDNSSKSVDKKVENTKDLLAQLEKDPDKLVDAYKEITGKELTTDEVDKLNKGDNVLKDSDVAKRTQKYKESQTTAVDVAADLVSGVTSALIVTGAVAAGVVAAPFTAGASLAGTAALIAGAGAAGAAVKVAFKSADAASGGRTYDSLGYDLATGFVNGALAPVTNGAGSAVTSSVAKRLGYEIVEEGGKQIIKTAAKEGVEQVVAHGMKATVAKTVAFGTGMAIEGSLDGAIDNSVRHVASGGDISDLPKAALEGAAAGAVLSPVIGGSMKAATRAGKSIGGVASDAKLAFKQSKIDFANIQKVDSPDILFAQEMGSIIKQAGGIVDNLGTKGKSALSDASVIINNLDTHINGFADDLKGISTGLSSKTTSYGATLNEAIEAMKAGKDPNQILIRLADQAQEIAQGIQSRVETGSAALNNRVGQIAAQADGLHVKTNEILETLGQTIDDASNLAKNGIEAGKQIKDTSFFKALGSIPERTKETVSVLKKSGQDLGQTAESARAKILAGNTAEGLDDLQKYYDEVKAFEDTVNESIQSAEETASRSGLKDYTATLKERISSRVSKDGFDNLSNTAKMQAVIEDSNIAFSKFIQTMSSNENLPPEMKKLFKEFTSNCTVSRNMDQAQELANELYGNGKYTIKKSFGAGTIGETYLAKDANGKEVVIKMLKDGVNPQKFDADKQAIVKYINEFETDATAKEYKLSLVEGLFDSWNKELDFQQEALGAQNMAKNAKRFDVAQTLEVGSKNGQNVSLVMEKASGVRLDTLSSMANFVKENPTDYMTKSIKDAEGKELNPWIKNADMIEDNPWLKDTDSWTKTVPVAYQKAQNEQFMFATKTGNKTLHADPHGGNVFVDVDVKTGKPKITYIDTGNTVQRTNAEVLKDLGWTMNLMVGNSKGIAEKLLDGAKLPSGASKKEITDKLAQELDTKLFKAGVNLKDIDFTQNTMNGILKDLGVIPDAGNANFFKASLQRVKTHRELLDSCGEAVNRKQDLKDLAVGMALAFKSNPKEAVKTFGPIIKYVKQNDYDAMRVFFQMFQKMEVKTDLLAQE